MQVQGTPCDLLPGDPLCAPATTAMVEASISLLRTLHKNENWMSIINDMVIKQMGKINKFEALVEQGNKSHYQIFSLLCTYILDGHIFHIF